MLDKPFAVLMGVGTFLFVGAIVMESTPQARLNMTCAPVRWGGNIVGSIAALTDSNNFTDRIASGTDDLDYGCQFTLWRLVYGKEYTARMNGEASASIKKKPVEDNEEVLSPGGMSVSSADGQRAKTERVKLVEKN